MQALVLIVIFLVLGLFILIAQEWRERKRAKTAVPDDEEQTPAVVQDGECCGQHLVCEKETLLNSSKQIEYYDDEELDSLSGIAAEAYTEEQANAIKEVFYTLREEDVAGWLRSLQMRNIALPEDVREEALLIVSERRSGHQS